MSARVSVSVRAQPRREFCPYATRTATTLDGIVSELPVKDEFGRVGSLGPEQEAFISVGSRSPGAHEQPDRFELSTGIMSQYLPQELLGKVVPPARIWSFVRFLFERDSRVFGLSTAG